VKPETIKIDDVVYVRADTIITLPETVDGMPYKIVRCDRTGVFAGYIESRNGREVVIRKARRLWYWAGAASLSQLAMEGVRNPRECKFPCEVDRVEVLDAVEILDVTAQAKISIDDVPVWS
jgi:hypothetical protein